MKFILGGGYMPKAKDGGRAFCEEMVKGLKEPVKILDCLFAKPKEIWETKFKMDQEWFAEAIPDVKFNFSLASKADFLNELQRTDVLLLRGGKSNVLLDRLREQEGWLEKLDGTVIAGESAGANIFAKYFYALGNKQVREGLGELPIKLLVHYGADYEPTINWPEAKKALESYGDNLELVTLKECEYKVFKQ